ncbi:MAG: Tetratricopeptide 2 repeat protein, partial [Verrucomicrobiales bacterium]|nr:Tetratricopeptide 2 repeat protein [Verrucomicrobiales bacterium]
SWQPGRRVQHRTDGLAWPLETNTDLVLQLHLNPSGKLEKIQPSVGFYFAKQPPSAFPVKTWLSSYDIDIPAGSDHYVITNSYVLPADATLLAILPHAHYTATRIEVTAAENGISKTLLSIPRWDFNWQGDYVYREPIPVRKGTVLSMNIEYDNSSHNPRNPSNPPKRIVYGLNSTNEMGEVWFQLLPVSQSAYQAYQADYKTRIYQDSIRYNEFLLRNNPRDAVALSTIGVGWMALNELNKAEGFFLESIKVDPTADFPYYHMASLQIQKGNLPRAYAALQKATRMNARNFKSQGLLGVVCSQLEKFDEAELHYNAALRLNPNDATARENLSYLSVQRAKAASRPR